ITDRRGGATWSMVEDRAICTLHSALCTLHSALLVSPGKRCVVLEVGYARDYFPPHGDRAVCAALKVVAFPAHPLPHSALDRGLGPLHGLAPRGRLVPGLRRWRLSVHLPARQLRSGPG